MSREAMHPHSFLEGAGFNLLIASTRSLESTTASKISGSMHLALATFVEVSES